MIWNIKGIFLNMFQEILLSKKSIEVIFLDNWNHCARSTKLLKQGERERRKGQLWEKPGLDNKPLSETEMRKGRGGDRREGDVIHTTPQYD